MYKKKFYFIVFEGIEGTGKSFQIKKLSHNLKKRGLPVVTTREPGGSKTADLIRNLIFSKKSNNFDPLTDYFLFLASRNEHIKNTIIKAKKNRKILICDRFIDSTYAYQIKGNNINAQLNKTVHKYLLKGLKPDITIILKSNLKSIRTRLKKRKNNNKFDKLKNNLLKKIQNTFINIAKNTKNYFVFNSSNNDNKLEQQILNLILKKIQYK